MRILFGLALSLAACVLLFLALKRPSSNLAALSGACLALAAWTSPAALGIAPLLAAPLFDRRWPLRARLHLTASGLLGLGLTLVPWLFRRV